MPSKFLTTSTPNPADSSAGILLTDCMRLCDPDRFSFGLTSPGPENLRVSWGYETPEARFSHQVVFRTTAGLPFYNSAALLRTLCHVVVSAIPAPGLFDAYECLTDVRDHYLFHWPASGLAEQRRRTIVKGKKGQVYERAPFQLTEE